MTASQNLATERFRIVSLDVLLSTHRVARDPFIEALWMNEVDPSSNR